MPELEQKFLILRTGFNSVKGWNSHLNRMKDQEGDEPADKKSKTDK